MADFLTASLVFALLVFSVSVSAGQRIITEEPGENVILTCGKVQNKDVRVVEWSRTDLESDQYVLLYRNNQSDPVGQSPSFRNRVDLQDVKNRDVSLVLKNVTTDDTGTYECRVVQRGNNQPTIKNTEPICIVNLRVEAGNKEKQEVDGGNKDGGMKTEPISIINLRVEAAGQRNIPAEPRDNVIQGCSEPENKEAKQGNSSRRRRSVRNNCNNPGNEEKLNEDGRKRTGLIVGVPVCAVVALLLVGAAAVFYKRSRYSSPRSNRPPAAADAEETLTGLDE